MMDNYKIPLVLVNFLEIKNLLYSFTSQANSSHTSIIINIDNNFTWRDTDEGHYFWSNIEKEYDLFLRNHHCFTNKPYLNYKTIQNETKHKNYPPPF